MIDYKLAKQLKEAGFPQKGQNKGIKIKGFAYNPTLSELIEAFGCGYFKLEHTNCAWTATAINKKRELISAFDEDRDAAVAKLYIKLKKNK